MTKHIRIENADTSDHKVVVEVWERGAAVAPNILDDSELVHEADKLIKTVPLDHPTALIQETIWKERYLIIKEV